MDGGGQCPHISLHEMILFVCFMYICELADVWRPPTSSTHFFLIKGPIFLPNHTLLRIVNKCVCNIAEKYHNAILQYNTTVFDVALLPKFINAHSIEH